MKSAGSIKKLSTKWFLLSILLGFVVRLYVFHHTYVINSDGVFYINQAKLLYAGDWKAAVNCGYNFISLYHLLIPLSYSIFGDWVTAAKSVALFFGTFSMIPFFLILRQLYPAPSAFAAGLIMAVSPFFVSNSVEVIKDPLFWFFSLWGIFFFICGMRSDRGYHLLVLSCLCFLAGALARFESLVYFAGTFSFMLFFGEGKVKRLFFFSLPLSVLIMVALSSDILYQGNLHILEMYIIPRVQSFTLEYSGRIFSGGIVNKTFEFLEQIPSKALKVVYAPFIPFIIAVIPAFKREFTKEKFFGYILTLFALSSAALYLFYLAVGVLSSRYFVFALLPLFFMMGAAMETVLHAIGRFFQKEGAFWIVIAYIILASLFSNLEHKRTDKLIYKNIGEYIAAAESKRSVNIMAPDSRISFYANLYADRSQCTNRLGTYDDLTKRGYNKMTALLRNDGIRYLVWDKRSWENANYNFWSFAKRDFETVASWETGDNRFTLLRLK